MKHEKMERVPVEEIEKLKDKLDIVDLISNDIKLRRTGNKLKGECLLCHKDSFVVYPETCSYYCFSCGNGGDVINYIKNSRNISYKEALHIAFDFIGKVPSQVDMVQNLMLEAARFYYKELKTNPKAKIAIDTMHGWGINGKTIVNLGLGFHDDTFNCLIKHFQSAQKYNEKMLESVGLIAKSSIGTYYDKFRNSIIIPTVSVEGKLKCFDFYALNEGRVYRSSCVQDFDRTLDLYSLNLAVKSNKKSVVIVSSYEDCFMLIGQGITNVVSTYLPRITDKQLGILKQYFKVIIPFVPSYMDFSLCYKYCNKDQGLYCSEIKMKDESTPKEYCQKYGFKEIVCLIDDFEITID